MDYTASRCLSRRTATRVWCPTRPSLNAVVRSAPRRPEHPCRVDPSIATEGPIPSTPMLADGVVLVPRFIGTSQNARCRRGGWPP